MARKKPTTRKDNRIEKKVTVINVNGQKKRLSVYGYTQKELEEKVAEILARNNRGFDVDAEKQTFGFYAEIWLDGKNPENGGADVCSFKRFTSYLARLKHMSKAPFYNMPVKSIRQIHLQGYINNASAYFSVSTLRTDKSVLTQIFKLAKQNRAIEFNPAEDIRIPKKKSISDGSGLLSDNDEAMHRVLSQIEQERITEHIPTAKSPTASEIRGHIIAMILLYTGMRPNELVPLTWRDIDFDKNLITVNKSVSVTDKSGCYKLKSGTKTAEKGERVIPMHYKLRSFLLSLEHGTNMLICTDAHGNMLSENSLRSTWESYMHYLNWYFGDFSKITDENGIPFKKPSSRHAPVKIPFVIENIKLYDLRHTCITNWANDGISDRTLRSIAGHTDIRTTQKYYIHDDIDHLQNEYTKIYGGE